MDFLIYKSKERNPAEIISLNLIFMLFLFRTAYPLMKYPFLIFYSGALIYFVCVYKKIILKEFILFAKSFPLIFLLFFILILSFFLSDKLYLMVFKEIVNCFIILSLYFMLTLAIDSKWKLDYFFNNLVDLCIVFGLAIALLGILQTFAIISFRDSSILDYNFALLPVYFSIVGISYRLTKRNLPIQKILYSIFFITLLLRVFLSGSRRGIIIILILTTILVVFKIYAFIFKNKIIGTPLADLKKAVDILLVFLMFIPFIYYLVIFNTSYVFKENALTFFGIKNKSAAKINLAYNLTRYVSLFGSDINSNNLYNKIWSPDIDPKDPDSGWGTGIHKTIYPLTGENVGIVPEGVKGCLFDSASITRKANRKPFSIKLLKDLRVRKGDILEASVYCYVPNNFTGGSVELIADGSAIGIVKSEYKIFNLKNNNRGKDYNLFSNGNFQNGTRHWLPNADSTKHQIIETPFGKGIRVSRKSGREGNWPLQYGGRQILFYSNHEYKFHFYFKVIKGATIPFKIGWWLNDAGQGQTKTADLPLEIKNIQDGWKEATCSYRFKETHTTPYVFMNSLQSNSIVDFANVGMFDLDNQDSVPAFVDEDRGTWQKLSVESICRNGRINVSLNFSKDGIGDFPSLKGYVIYAYPQFRIINKSDSSIFGIASNNRLPGHVKPQNYRLSDFPNYVKADLLSSDLLFYNTTYPDSIEHDAIRRFALKLISEDTAYHGYKSNLSVDTISDDFMDLRIVRWQFALQIYAKEFGWFRRLFGGGWNFLNWYSNYFEKDKTISDYPHNPFLSVLLYSGLVGLLLYLLLLFQCFKYYYVYLKEYYVLSLFFIITFFFSFFSGGDPFDPPMMGFFIILPLFIHHIYKKLDAKI